MRPLPVREPHFLRGIARSRSTSAIINPSVEHQPFDQHETSPVIPTSGLLCETAVAATLAATGELRSRHVSREVAAVTDQLPRMFGPVNSAIALLDKAIEEVREHADTAAAQALTDAKAEPNRFGDRLNELGSSTSVSRRRVRSTWRWVRCWASSGGDGLSYRKRAAINQPPSRGGLTDFPSRRVAACRANPRTS